MLPDTPINIESILGQFTASVHVSEMATQIMRADLQFLQQAGDIEDFTTPEELDQVIDRVQFALYGSVMGGVKLPLNFHETPVGMLISNARAWTYPEEWFCTTQQEAAAFLGRDRSSVRNYEDQGWLHPVWRQRNRQYLWRELEWLKNEHLPSIAKGV